MAGAGGQPLKRLEEGDFKKMAEYEVPGNCLPT